MKPVKIGLVGYQGAGKDTFAEYAEGWSRASFAEPIKKVANLFGMLESGREDKEVPRTLRLDRGVEPLPEYVEELFSIQPTNADRKAFRSALAAVLQPYTLSHSLGATTYQLSPRRFQQLLGTEIGRELYGEGFWVRQSLRDLPEKVLFTDVRFSNEAYQMDALIYISREGTSTDTSHNSEKLVNYLAERFNGAWRGSTGKWQTAPREFIQVYHFENNGPNKRGLKSRVDALLTQIKEDLNA